MYGTYSASSTELYKGGAIMRLQAMVSQLRNCRASHVAGLVGMIGFTQLFQY
jgi:hypothetical protein